MAGRRPGREYDFTLTIRQIAAIVGGSMFVLSIAFGLGVGFGHRLATAPVATARTTDLDQLDARPSPSPTPPPLTYQQELTKNDNGKAPAPAPKPSPSPSPVVEEKPVPSPSPVPAVADKPAAPEPAIAPPPEAPAPKGERWTIQFGSAKQKAEADKIVQKLSAAGLDPFVVEADVPGKGHMYRVRVGQFGSKEAAERTRAQAQERTKLSGVCMPMQ